MFSESGIYHVPKNTAYTGCIDYIKSLPMNPRPEVFGLHENADITKNNYETNLVCRLLNYDLFLVVLSKNNNFKKIFRKR